MRYIQLKTIEDFKSATKGTKWQGKTWMWETFRENTCYIPEQNCFINLEKAEKL